MSKWSTILRLGRNLVVNPATRSMGRAAVSPVRTLHTAGSAVKNATIGAGVGYVGWQALVNDKPVVRTVADVAIGSENVDRAVETASGVADRVGEAVSGTGEAIGNVADSVRQSGNALSGISDFMRNLNDGQGGNMFGNFLSNLLGANVSGMSMAGLLAAGLMIFGRTGFLGKIGGILLAMMLIGNNSNISQSPDGQQASPGQQPGGMRR